MKTNQILRIIAAAMVFALIWRALTYVQPAHVVEANDCPPPVTCPKCAECPAASQTNAPAVASDATHCPTCPECPAAPTCPQCPTTPSVPAAPAPPASSGGFCFDTMAPEQIRNRALQLWPVLKNSGQKAVIGPRPGNWNGPTLISYPRSGSHWFRTLSELYFEQPTLVNNFYWHNKHNYLFLHEHDRHNEVKGKQNVIYLYRDPVDVVYSQLKYDHNNLWNPKPVENLAREYAGHVNRWVAAKDKSPYPAKITIIYYSRLQNDIVNEWQKVVHHLKGKDVQVNAERIQIANGFLDKKKIGKLVPQDPNVVNNGVNYDEQRAIFRMIHQIRIWNIVNQVGGQTLLNAFPDNPLKSEAIQKMNSAVSYSQPGN